jgi:hypothetical protein
MLIGMFDKNEVFDKEIEQETETNPNDFFNRKLF